MNYFCITVIIIMITIAVVVLIIVVIVPLLLGAKRNPNSVRPGLHVNWISFVTYSLKT